MKNSMTQIKMLEILRYRVDQLKKRTHDIKEQGFQNN